MTIDASSQPPAAGGDDGDSCAVLCPGCGYDLRGASRDRCSECGLEIDWNAVRASDIPWAHRRAIRRVRAFWKTVWYVTIDTRRIRQELARPQDARDAGWFRAWLTASVWVALVGGAALAVGQVGLGAVAVLPFEPFTPGQF